MSDDPVAVVGRLVRDFKKAAGPTGASPEDVSRHVALALGVSDDIARELIVQAGLRGANPWPPPE